MRIETALSVLSRGFRVTLAGVAIWYFAVYLVLAFFRMPYPFWFEWQEGFGVDVVIRILSGDKLYVRPSVEFISCIYTPFYFYVSALVSKIVGVGFTPLRLVSFLSSLGSFFLIYRIVQRETQSRFAGLLAFCQFAATFKIISWWFDYGRADSLFLFLLLAALYFIRFHAGKTGWLAAAILMSLSFLTKQTTLIVAFPMILYCFLANRRLSYYFIIPFLAITAGSTWILNLIHDGWYWYYVFELPAQHGIVKEVWLTFWTGDLFSKLPIACAMAFCGLVFSQRDFPGERRLFYFLFALGMILASWIGRLHYGGITNCLMPVYAMISILFGLGAQALFSGARKMESFAKQKGAEILVCIVGLLSFLLLYYDPLPVIRNTRNIESGMEFISKMSQMEGEVFVPYHGYLPVLAGKKSYAHSTWIWDILRSHEGPVREGLVRDLRDAMRERRFSVIIIPRIESGPMMFRFNPRLVWWSVARLERYYTRLPQRLLPGGLDPKSRDPNFVYDVFVPKKFAS